MNTVAFAFRTDSVPEGKLLPDKQSLFSKIKERDVVPVVSLHAEEAFLDDGLESHELLGESETRSLGRIGMEQVKLIMNRLDRSIKYDNVPHPWQDAMPPVANENAFRSLVFRKHRVQAEVLDDLHLGIPTHLIEEKTAALGFVASTPAAEYIVELNGRMPYLVGSDKHAGVADALRTAYADQIQQVVSAQSGVIQ